MILNFFAPDPYWITPLYLFGLFYFLMALFNKPSTILDRWEIWLVMTPLVFMLVIAAAILELNSEHPFYIEGLSLWKIPTYSLIVATVINLWYFAAHFLYTKTNLKLIASLIYYLPGIAFISIMLAATIEVF